MYFFFKLKKMLYNQKKIFILKNTYKLIFVRKKYIGIIPNTCVIYKKNTIIMFDFGLHNICD
jgi:hypothetical protein